ncbi:Clp protease N-terminal domain-containing protein [Saccharothrix hoggarensis]|uniref:Clp protease N-terminal domain-containing protein n=1 Tax=Saccharothrix hoggarensis TaxID=913853 RepID=A0ABW3QQI6_9PSEU
MTGDPIDYERWTLSARSVLGSAMEHARRHGHHRVDTGHLLLGIASDPNGPAYLSMCGLDAVAVRAEVEAVLRSSDQGPRTVFGLDEFALTDDARAALESVARDVPEGPIGPLDLLVGLVREPAGAAGVLVADGLTPEGVRDAYRGVMDKLKSGSWSGSGPGLALSWPAREPEQGAVPAEIREITDRVVEARRRKEAAIEAQDWERAAAERDVEKDLLAARAERVRELAGTLDVLALVEELEALRTGVVARGDSP